MKDLCHYCLFQDEYVAEDLLNARTCDKKDCLHYKEFNAGASRSSFVVKSQNAAIEALMQKVEALEAKVSALQYQLDTGEKPE